MQIEFITKNYYPEEKLRQLITKKLERLDKYLEADTKAKVVLKHIQNQAYTLELTIFADSAVMRAEVVGQDMQNNIDAAIPKIERQIIKHNAKLISKSKKFRQKAVSEAEAKEAESHRKVVKSKAYKLIPMTVEDAIEEQELIGHSFYVFLNKASERINVLYRRNDGDYGLIETE